jgi:hypothetical protein
MTAATLDQPRRSASPSLWAGRVLSSLFVAFMIFDIALKLLRLPIVEQTGAQLGLPKGSGFGIGVVEAIIVALYLVPRTTILGAVLVTALMGGTAAIHFQNANPVFSHILFGPYLALFAWGGLWLRNARLREIFPIVR